MAAALQTDILLQIAAHLTRADDLVTLDAPTVYRKTASLPSGSGITAVGDVVFSDTRTLAASASETLDLIGTALQDPFGANISMARLKLLLIVASALNTNDVLVGGGSNPVIGWQADATDIVVVRPGGILFWFSPLVGCPITATTGDLLKIANSAGTTGVTYDVLLIGASA